MRTTVTVDPDVEQLLRAAMHQTGQSFKVTLNQALRKGLTSTYAAVEEEPFKVAPLDMGLRAGIDPAWLQQVADDMDVDSFLDLTNQLRAVSEAREAQ